ncbi:MAG TPA: GtrA family protein [Candidatus Saccharimonadales bacterium]
MIKKFWGNKVCRFITIGVINTVTDITILSILVFGFGLKEIVANVISASISITLSYFWNHFIVFRHKDKVTLKLFLKFFAVTGFGVLGIQELVIAVVQHYISIHSVMTHTNLSHTLSKVVLDEGTKLFAVAISMVWNFFVYTFAIFKEDKEEEGVVPY